MTCGGENFREACQKCVDSSFVKNVAGLCFERLSKKCFFLAVTFLVPVGVAFEEWRGAWNESPGFYARDMTSTAGLRCDLEASQHVLGHTNGTNTVSKNSLVVKGVY